jgi:hypothetical protein
VAPVAGLAIALGCQGPDQFLRYSDTPGTAGSSATGTAGTTGSGGTGTGTGGTGGGPTGLGGSNSGTAGASAGSIGTGTGGSATGTGGTVSPAGAGGGAGTSAGRGGSGGSATGSGGGAGSVVTGTGGSTGTAGSSGTAGATGVGGATGTAGRGGTAGTGGSATGTAGAIGTAGTTGSGGSAAGATGTGGSAAGATGTGGGGGTGTVDRIQVVAKCQSTNGAQDIRVTFKILNPGAVTKQWSDIKVRYYFTAMTSLPAMVKFDFTQTISSSMITSSVTDTYVEIGFMTGTGTVSAFDNVTGSNELQLHLYNYGSPTWNMSQTDDYSYVSCAGVTDTNAYSDRTTMPGYYQGQLAWGAEPMY